MKNIFTLFCLLVATQLFAQQSITDNTLVPNQNPNYLVSQNKYMAFRDSLLATMNTTTQHTYKAFDWYELKMQKKDTRFQNRQQRRTNRSLNFNNWNGNNWGANNWWNHPTYFNNWGGNNWWNNGFIHRPSIGFNTGNWWFWF